MRFRRIMMVGALLIVIVMLLSGVSALYNGANSLGNHSGGTSVSHSVAVISNAEMRMVPVVASNGSLGNDVQTPYSGNITVMVTFSFHNQSRLSTFLSNLSNPPSTMLLTFCAETGVDLNRLLSTGSIEFESPVTCDT